MGQEKLRNRFARFMKTFVPPTRPREITFIEPIEAGNTTTTDRVPSSRGSSGQGSTYRTQVPSLDWTRRPEKDRGRPNKYVLGPVTVQDRKMGSFFVHLHFAKRPQLKNLRIGQIDTNQFYEGDNCKKPRRRLPPLHQNNTTDNAWERTYETPTPTYFDIFKPYESQLNKALRPSVRFMEQPELKKLRSKRKLPLILPDPTPAREPLLRRILQCVWPCIPRVNGRIRHDNEEGGFNINFRVIKKVGSGGQAETYLVRRWRGTRYIAKLSRETAAPLEMRQEFALMKSLRHRHVARVACEVPRGYLMPVYRTDLYEFVVSRRCNLRYSFYLTKCLFSAVRYIHGLKIAHLDIKPENILLNHRNEPKLSDFGASLSFFSNNTTRVFQYLRSSLGSLPYLSPELLDERKFNAMNLIDSWATGVTLYFALTNGVLLYGISRQHNEMLRRIQADERMRPRDYDFYMKQSPGYRRLISIIDELVEKSPIHRLTVTEACKRGW